MNRREFIKGLGLATLSALVPQLVQANQLGFSGQRKIVLLVELKGANDGLNTLVPFTDPAYLKARPKLALDPNTLHPVSARLGLHPALEALLPAWSKGEMAWVQGVGYDQPNRSHFESIEIWDSANLDRSQLHDGWIAKSFPGYQLGGIAVDTNLGPLYGDNFSALSVTDPQRFIDQGKTIKKAYSKGSSNRALQHILSVQSEIDMLADTLASYLKDIPNPAKPFAPGAFGRNLKSIYTLIASGINVPAYKITLGNFDTHVNQLHTHKILLKTLGEELGKFRHNLIKLGMWDEVVVMTYSEFGRRVHENGSRGTDHGTAAAHMIMGGKISGGLYGEYPSLTDLDERGDMYHTVDFRDLYATLQQNWWRVPVNSGTALSFI